MKQVFNPFLPLSEYIPDGEPHVFGDRVYLFGSHDKENGESFCMLDYEFWSAPVNDLTSWTSKGINYRASQDPLYDAEKMPHMYAPDVVQGNDGRFYLYYCLSGFGGKGCYVNPISVAVSDSPDGQYEYLGQVKDKGGQPLMTYVCFDPGLMNDDGVIRLYYGASFEFDEHRRFGNNWIFNLIEAKMFKRSVKTIKNTPGGVMGAFTVELEDDMLTAKTAPIRLLNNLVKRTSFEGHGFFEASSFARLGIPIISFIPHEITMNFAMRLVSIQIEILFLEGRLFLTVILDLKVVRLRIALMRRAPIMAVSNVLMANGMSFIIG